MKSEIVNQAKNPFLRREELILKITSKSAPSKTEVKKEIGEDENLIVIKKINTSFGRQTFIVEAVIYDNIEAKEKIETIPQKIREKMAADKKAEEEARKKKAEEEAESTKVETEKLEKQELKTNNQQ